MPMVLTSQHQLDLLKSTIEELTKENKRLFEVALAAASRERDLQARLQSMRSPRDEPRMTVEAEDPQCSRAREVSAALIDAFERYVREVGGSIDQEYPSFFHWRAESASAELYFSLLLPERAIGWSVRWILTIRQNEKDESKRVTVQDRELKTFHIPTERDALFESAVALIRRRAAEHAASELGISLEQADGRYFS